MKNVGKKMAVGAVWMVLFRFLEKGIGLVSTIILVRLLVPEDFGVVALATATIAMLELMSAFGFDWALIQNQKATRKEYGTAWTYNVIFAILSAAILALLAIPAAGFYSEPRLEDVMYLLAIGVLINGFENIGIVAFRKEMTFDKEFRFLLGKKLAGFFVVIPLAFILENYWALIIGMLAARLYGLIASYVLHPYRPCLSLAATSKLINFSKWILINNIFNFVRMRAPDLVIGRMLGTAQLGVYTVSFEISNMVTTELIAPINRAVYPGYAALTHDKKAFSDNFLMVIVYITMFALPAGIGMLAIAELFVHVVLGQKWIEAIPLIKILAVYGALTALQTNISYVYVAYGKPNISVYLTGIFIVISIPLLLFFIQTDGLVGAANAYFIATSITLPIYFYIVSKNMLFSVLDLLKAIWRTIAATFIMYVSVSSFVIWATIEGPIYIQIIKLAIALLIGVLSYVVSLYLLWSIDKSGKPEKQVIDKVLGIIRKQTTQ